MGVISGRYSHNHAGLDRDPGRVPHDLHEDWISKECARDVYRVVTVGSGADDSPALGLAAVQARRAFICSAG
jgi:N-methylhydantoinase B